MSLLFFQTQMFQPKYILRCFSRSNDPSTFFCLVQPRSTDAQVETGQEELGAKAVSTKKAEFITSQSHRLNWSQITLRSQKRCELLRLKISNLLCQIPIVFNFKKKKFNAHTKYCFNLFRLYEVVH